VIRRTWLPFVLGFALCGVLVTSWGYGPGGYRWAHTVNPVIGLVNGEEAVSGRWHALWHREHAEPVP
jgi:hypothetical protein